MAVTTRTVPNTEATLAVVRHVFPQEMRGLVSEVLAAECGANLPLCETCTGEQLDRVRFAVLKLSGGDLARLRWAVHDAQRDWRDVLIAAGFGTSLEAHRQWADSLKT